MGKWVDIALTLAHTLHLMTDLDTMTAGDIQASLAPLEVDVLLAALGHAVDDMTITPSAALPLALKLGAEGEPWRVRYDAEAFSAELGIGDVG